MHNFCKKLFVRGPGGSQKSDSVFEKPFFKWALFWRASLMHVWKTIFCLKNHFLNEPRSDGLRWGHVWKTIFRGVYFPYRNEERRGVATARAAPRRWRGLLQKPYMVFQTIFEKPILLRKFKGECYFWDLTNSDIIKNDHKKVVIQKLKHEKKLCNQTPITEQNFFDTLFN